MSVATAEFGGGYPEIPDIPGRMLSLVTDENMELYATLDDIDTALKGEDYEAIIAGFGATLCGEEERIAAAALARQPLTGGKRIL